MHIFLQGPRNIGKSTVISKTLEILTAHKQLILGGFFTWHGGNNDPNIYMRPAGKDGGSEVYHIAGLGKGTGGMVSNIEVFESEGVRLIQNGKNSDLIIMDELGYLEGGAPGFRQAILDAIGGDSPILGVMRLGDIPWHHEIKRRHGVTLYGVNEENRDSLPQKLSDILFPLLNNKMSH